MMRSVYLLGAIGLLSLVTLAACGSSSSGLDVNSDDGGAASGSSGGTSGSGAGGSGGASRTGGSVTDGGAAGGAGSGTGGAPGGGGSAGSGTAGSGGGSVTPQPPTSPCQHVDAFCSRLESCAGLFLQLLFGDRKTCVERALIACRDEAMARNTGLNATTSAACASAIQKATCTDIFANKIDACVIKGTVGNGLGCGADSQCMSGLCRRSGDVCGVCALKSAAGGPCRKDKNEDCQLGLVCADQQCAAPVGEGAACSKRVPCTFGLYCSSKTATCTKVVSAAGAACEKDGCDLSKNLVCNDQAKVCQIFRVAQPGESCGIGINPPTLCPFGEFEKMCRPNVIIGVCAKPALEGEPCGPAANGTECLAPAYCAAGVCKLASAATCPTP